MHLLRFSAALAAAACLHATAVAQTNQAATPTREEAQANTRAFVDQIAFSTGDEDGLARWDTRVCVGAVGLQPAQAQALVDRISARAQSVGLRAGEPGCQANVMVIYAPDSDTLTRQIVDQRRDLLGFYSEDGRVTAGREAMAEFAGTPRAIRWWHISDSGVGTMRPETALSHQSRNTAAAQQAASSSGGGGAPGDTRAGQGTSEDVEGMDAVRMSGTRARPEVRNNLSYVLIVVDARRVANAPASAWMDYVAFGALAQLDPNARTTSYPTILNLFSTPEGAPTELTAWDIAYLEGLYNARPETANRQAASIARRMAGNMPYTQ